MALAQEPEFADAERRLLKRLSAGSKKKATTMHPHNLDSRSDPGRAPSAERGKLLPLEEHWKSMEELGQPLPR